MRLCDEGNVCREKLPESRYAMEVKHAVMDVDAEDETTRNETCLHPHDWDVTQFEVTDALAIGRNTGEVGEVVWKKRGTAERARWHAGLSEPLVRVRKVFHEDLLGCEESLQRLTVHDIGGIVELESA